MHQAQNSPAKQHVTCKNSILDLRSSSLGLIRQAHRFIAGIFSRLEKAVSLSKITTSVNVVYLLEIARAILKYVRTGNSSPSFNTRSLSDDVLVEMLLVYDRLFAAIMECEITDVIGTWLALLREILLFPFDNISRDAEEEADCQAKRKRVSFMNDLRQKVSSSLLKWFPQMNSSVLDSALKKQFFIAVSCSLPTSVICSPSSDAFPFAASQVRSALQSVLSSKLVVTVAERLRKNQIPVVQSTFCFTANDAVDDVSFIRLYTSVILKMGVLLLRQLENSDPMQRRTITLLMSIIESGVDVVKMSFSLYSSQDDILIDVIWLLLEGWMTVSRMKDVTDGDFHRDLDIVCRNFNPHLFAIHLIDLISYDHTVLLDWLIECDTEFLRYFLVYLKLLKSDWDNFQRVATTEQLDKVMPVLIRLRLAIERLQDQELFPYKVNYLLQLLKHVEDTYETKI